MTEVRFLPPEAKYIKKLKDKKLKPLSQEAVDKIRADSTAGEAKTGDLSGVYGYNIYYNKTNYELAYTVVYQKNVVIVIMAGTRENFYDQLAVSFFRHLNVSICTSHNRKLEIVFIGIYNLHGGVKWKGYGGSMAGTCRNCFDAVFHLPDFISNIQ